MKNNPCPSNALVLSITILTIALLGFSEIASGQQIAFIEQNPSPRAQFYVPMTAQERWRDYVQENFTRPGAFFQTFFTALCDQTGNKPMGWGRGIDSEDPRNEPQVYEFYVQRPVASFSVMLRSTVDPTSLTPALRHVVAQLDSELPLLRVMSMDGVIEVQRNGNPLFSRLLATFAILALILSAIGIYGLIAYSVGQRTHEIGIRLALGAKPSDISRMILRQGFKVAAVGLAIGFTMALPLSRVFDLIFQGLIHFSAPAVYPIVLAVMVMVVFCATLGPAQRATRVDATTALRNE
jgi:FtsX-like permease family